MVLNFLSVTFKSEITDKLEETFSNLKERSQKDTSKTESKEKEEQVEKEVDELKKEKKELEDKKENANSPEEKKEIEDKEKKVCLFVQKIKQLLNINLIFRNSLLIYQIV